MDSDSLLVLGSNRNKALSEKLFELGFTAIVRESMQKALEKLRTGMFCGIVVDAAHSDCDALEFVLNVRDLNGDIPVIIIGDFYAGSESRLLLADDRVIATDNIESAEDCLRRIISPGTRESKTGG